MEEINTYSVECLFDNEVKEITDELIDALREELTEEDYISIRLALQLLRNQYDTAEKNFQLYHQLQEQHYCKQEESIRSYILEKFNNVKAEMVQREENYEQMVKEIDLGLYDSFMVTKELGKHQNMLNEILDGQDFDYNTKMKLIEKIGKYNIKMNNDVTN